MRTQYYRPLVFAFALARVTIAGAQQPDSVEIRPTALTSVQVTPYSTNTQRFWIVNTGTQANQYSIFANVCNPYDLYCGWGNTFLGTIAPNDSVPFDVTFTASHAGSSGTVSFDARISTNQSIRATKVLTVMGRQEPHLEVLTFNPGGAEERDLCVTIAAATDAAYECGDLRIVHALPSVRARATTRTPTLLYNSRFAHPFGLVAATLSAGTSNATNVSATLTVTTPSGNIVVPQNYANSLFTAGSVQRLVLGFDAGALPTGVYPYTLAVSMVSGTTPVSKAANGTLIIVNRKDSPFGTGWWLAGYERIYVRPDSNLLWVGGDGSARFYVKGGTSFSTIGIDRPDSITQQGGNYVRHLRSGARVEFTSDGRHLATHDRLGLVTSFVHNQAGQLVNIDPAGFQSLRYTFAYRNNTGVLETVTAAPIGSATRVVSFTNRSDGRVSQIRDPDNTTVGFDYPNSGSFKERILSRTNRRNVVQSFAYDAAGKLVTVRVPLSATDTAVTTFCPAESRGFVITGCSAGPLHPDSAVTLVDGPRTDANDVTAFRLDRFGAPRMIRDALGNSTQLFRGNRTFPALVTRVVHANGWVNDAFHDDRGLITKLVQYAPLGPGRDAVTEYAWDPAWERVTQITYPEGNLVRFSYDPATGNRLSQEDGRGQPSRVDFAYNGQTGADRLLLASITYAADPQGVRARDTLQYDALGNLSLQRAAVGTAAERVTRFTNDNVGRQILTAADVVGGGSQQRRDSTVYDLMDRAIATKAYGFATTPAETLFTASTYDAEGNLRRLERWSYPDIPGSPIGHIVSRWGFDLANRAVADTAPDGRVETRTRDRAGNDTAVTTRRGHKIRMAYDAVSRLTTRRVPGLTFADTLAGIAARDNQPYPRRPNSGTDFAIAADSESFTYDPEGRLASAINGDARVTRDYFANGLLKSERLEVRDARTLTFSHSYLSQYSYDLNGRRTAVRLPPQLVPAGTRDSVAYAYDPVTSELQRVTDPLGNDFVYGYTLRGEPQSLTYPGSYAQRWSYFADGSIRTDSVLNLGAVGGSRLNTAVVRATSFTYDARGKLLNSADAVGFQDTVTATYSGLGYALSTRMRQNGQLQGYPISHRYVTVESQTYDALGNMASATTADTSWFNDIPQRTSRRTRNHTYSAGVGRLTGESNPGGWSKVYRYDADGNTEFVLREPSGGLGGESPNLAEDRFTYYAADGRVRAADYRMISNGLLDESPRHWVFEEYRYDALGRRVWVRAYRDCANYQQLSGNWTYLECHTGTLRRTIWDGEQELIEIQVPGDSVQPDPVLENDDFNARLPRDAGNNDPNPYFGRVLYINGLKLDRPIAITRYNYVDFFFGRPYTDFPPSTYSLYWSPRGQMSLATCATGSVSCQQNGFDMGLDIEAQWFTYDRPKFERKVFQGTLVHDRDDAAQTTYKRNRYYDPSAGRFTQEDPIGLAGGLNLYGFAGGDPVNFADPFGLFACPPDCGFEGDPRTLEREVQMVQSRSPRDVAVMAGAVVVATAGSLGITAATAGMLLRVAPIAAAAGARIPFEGFQEWGRNVVQWGSRAGGALERAAEITAEQAGQLDPQKVRMAREFYQKAVEAGRGLPASEARVQLMDRILELQRTTKQ